MTKGSARAAAMLGLVWSLGSCFDATPSGTDDFMEEDVPTFVCETEGDPSDCAPGDACSNSATCADGTVCSTQVANGERMPLACTAECVPPNDEGRWCTDDASCCDPATVCTVRGYCVAAP